MSLSIVHVIARLNVGGAALHVLQLAREQTRRGHDVIVVAGTLAAGEESMEYVADELGVQLVRLPVLQRELSLRADPAAILALRKLIRQRRPDVLHTHTAKAGATGRLAALAAGRACPRARRPHLPRPRPQRLLQQALGALFRWIERMLAHTSGTLVAVSDEVRDDLVGFGVAPARRFAVVPYGFDLPAWSEADDEARAGDPCRDRCRRRDVRRRVGRAAHRDQAPARPRPHAAHARRHRGRRAARLRRGRRGPRRGGGAGGRARRRRALPVRRLPEAAFGPGTRRSTRSS